MRSGSGGGAPRGTHAARRWPLSVAAIAAVTGFVFATTFTRSAGTDLRPIGGDVSSLVNDRNRQVQGLQDQARRLRDDIDQLSGDVSTGPFESFKQAAQDLLAAAGLTPVKGPGLRVELTDSPRSELKSGIDPNLLVVHEQDIQAFVNALWAGGAEAVSLQGQRLISTTGIKCVGNSVLLDGVPYAPPYRIEAVGDVSGMLASIDTTPETVTYADYSRVHKLGLDVTTLTTASIPAYAGTISLRYAQAEQSD